MQKHGLKYIYRVANVDNRRQLKAWKSVIGIELTSSQYVLTSLFSNCTWDTKKSTSLWLNLKKRFNKAGIVK